MGGQSERPATGSRRLVEPASRSASSGKQDTCERGGARVARAARVERKERARGIWRRGNPRRVGEAAAWPLAVHAHHWPHPGTTWSVGRSSTRASAASAPRLVSAQTGGTKG